MRLCIAKHIRQQDRLSLRADEYGSPLAVMFSLVLDGNVPPDLAAAINVCRPQSANLAWPGSGEALESHHIGHHGGQVGQRSFDDRILDGFHWLRLARRAMAFPQPLDGAESVWN
jgi:hypothetical protein